MVMPVIRVVEDNDDIYTLLVTVLRQHPTWHVVKRLDQRQVLERSAWDTVDLAVVDLMMPGVDGHEVLMFVREHFPGIKIMVVTAAGEARIEEAKPDADIVLRKPFDLQEFVTIAEQLVGV